ncbi:receptor-like protein EIX2 [Gossypium raimondii]|uniref:receptor-like protein EIX2 n=1 Tax=Gossypium raimondii TaxID=29730 RepID=UPI00227A3816|nr:receptor-like protein EIX2 [Gossypium raimondii]
MLVLMYILAVSGGSNGRCLEHEKQALLKFKEGLIDYGNLASWAIEKDCCRWRGVECDNRAGHIIRLDLHPVFSHADHDDFTWTPMDGVISSLLLDLRHLSHLDLSRNQFTKIPGFIGSLKELLGNLSRLLSLDVSNNNGDMISDNLEWHSGLSSLRTFKLSRTNLTMAVNWLHSIKAHPSLSSLYLQDCQFPVVDPSSLSHINSSKSLAVLQLIDSIVHPSTFPLLLNMSNKLTALHLSKNHLNGIIPISFAHMGSSLGNLRKLRTLLLNGNYINEPLPVILEKPSGCVKDSLQVLDLSVNQIKGSLPEIITRFSSLKELCPDDNKLDGALPDNVGNLSSLAVLNLARNKLTGSLPQSIGLMSGLKVLDVSSNSFNDFTSEIHFLKLSKLKFLTLSFNSLSLNFSSGWIPPFQLNTINLRCSKLGPSFPVWLQTQRNFSHLDISNSEISDNIPNWFWRLPSNLLFLNLSFNNLSGKFPDLHLRFNSFPSVSLSSNKFHGSIPRFLFNTTVLNLSKNMFSGTLSTFCSFINDNLDHVYLSDNQLSGNLPDCWMNFKQLVVLNLESNSLSGVIPSSFGSLHKLQTSLKLLDLGENRFSGNILLLNLSLNHLSSTIPTCLQNLTAMTSDHSAATYTGYASVVWKVVEQEYGKTLGLLKVIDLSSNNLSGEIPGELTSLVELITFKPVKKLVECCLNLSNNNPSGKIPLSTQLQSFLVESYMGNVGLCGLPLNAICPEDEKQQDGGVEHSNLDDEKLYKGSGFYLENGIDCRKSEEETDKLRDTLTFALGFVQK